VRIAILSAPAGTLILACGAARTPPVADAAPFTCPLGGCIVAPAASAPPDVARCAAGAACDGDPVKVCDAGNAAACTARGLDLWAAGESHAIVPLFERACTLGDAPGCNFAGRLYLDDGHDGHIAARDPARGLDLLARACDAGVILSCDVAAAYLGDAKNESDLQGKSDPEWSALRFTTEAECYRAKEESCFRAGLGFYTGDDGFPKDAKESTRFYGKGCDLGNLASCNNLANAIYYGDGCAADVARAAALWQDTCRGGEQLACANVGFVTEYGDGVARDMKRAEELYTASCANGSTYGCMHAAMMAEYHRGVPHDPAQAVEHWKKACEAKVFAACGFLGVMYEDGKGVARDSARADALFHRGADGGDARCRAWISQHNP
jgi:uncharacterized protein